MICNISIDWIFQAGHFDISYKTVRPVFRKFCAIKKMRNLQYRKCVLVYQFSVRNNSLYASSRDSIPGLGVFCKSVEGIVVATIYDKLTNVNVMPK